MKRLKLENGLGWGGGFSEMLKNGIYYVLEKGPIVLDGYFCFCCEERDHFCLHVRSLVYLSLASSENKAMHCTRL